MSTDTISYTHIYIESPSTYDLTTINTDCSAAYAPLATFRMRGLGEITALRCRVRPPILSKALECRIEQTRHIKSRTPLPPPRPRGLPRPRHDTAETEQRWSSLNQMICFNQGETLQAEWQISNGRPWVEYDSTSCRPGNQFRSAST